ncbi:MAG: aldolase/citrate lyase family protein [Planctomycetota bacterium]|nr:aldolase/citrate lyase family protein [Planctomycetota bacterium]
MNGIELAAALRSGQRAYGTLITSASPHLPERLRNAGLDFVFIDTEHIPIDDHDLSWMCQVYSGLDLVPLVRIPEPDPYRASKVLDGGAGGIIVPYIESVEQVEALRGAVKLRPLKGGKLAGVLDGTAPPGENLAGYLRERNEGKLLVINIESVPAVENLDELLAVPDIDAVLIGPHDLSTSMEIPEQYDHPDFDRTVRLIIEKARASGIGAGIHFWENLDQEIEWARHGANLFLHSADVLLFTASLKKDLATARQALGDGPAETGDGVDPI